MSVCALFDSHESMYPLLQSEGCNSAAAYKYKINENMWACMLVW
jgi:hypothetical protein